LNVKTSVTSRVHAGLPAPSRRPRIEADADIDRIIDCAEVTTVFQPIVDLRTGATVAYEALSRGPAGRLERPDLLFDAARLGGRLTELDELCRRTALTSAVEAAIFAPMTLFINVEPAALRKEALDEIIAISANAPSKMNIVLEITERALATDPAELLATVRRLRQAGWRIAIDDVGADDMSLTFMSLLHPDVIKIDMGLIQRQPDAIAAEIMNAVNAHAERSGCLLLAEGIERQAHVDSSLAFGARLGQGWKFGRPTRTVPSAPSTQVSGIDLPAAPPTEVSLSPFDSIGESIALRTSTKPLLTEISKHLERQAAALGSTGIIIGAFQEARHFTPATSRRYRNLASHVGFVAAIGAGLPEEPVRGVRGASLDATDPLLAQWDVAVLAPHFAAALIARDLGDDGPDDDRRFEFALTYDRVRVTAVAESLMTRILPREV
jgi:EAL domain-containing protein (putative c-di-GMP-specific phosphodiesterase class I)